MREELKILDALIIFSMGVRTEEERECFEEAEQILNREATRIHSEHRELLLRIKEIKKLSRGTFNAKDK